MKLNLLPLRPPSAPEEPDICALPVRGSGVDHANMLSPRGDMVVMGPAIRVEDAGSLVKAELVNEDDEFATPGEKRLEKALDLIFRYFFGASYGADKPGCQSSKRKLGKRLSDTLKLETLEQADEDLDEAVDLLETTLFLMERFMGRYPHLLLQTEFTSQMEEIADFLSNWGRGAHTAAEDAANDSKGGDQMDSILGEVVRLELE